MHPEGRRALRQLALLGVLVLAIAVGFVLDAVGVREWWVLAIIVSGVVVLGVVDTVRVYRRTKRSVVRMKARGERGLRLDEIRRIANGEPPR